MTFAATHPASQKVDGKPGDMTGNGFHDAFGEKGVSWKVADSVASASSSAPQARWDNDGYGRRDYWPRVVGAVERPRYRAFGDSRIARRRSVSCG